MLQASLEAGPSLGPSEQIVRFQICRPVPASASLREYIQMVQALPDDDSAELLGLHPEATRGCREAQGRNFMDCLITLEPGTCPSLHVR